MKARLTATAVAGTVATVLVIALAPASVATVNRDRPPLRSDPRALQLLERAVRAPATTAYSGTQFVSAWGSSGTTTALVQVTNLPGYGTVTRVTSSPGVTGGVTFTAQSSTALDGEGSAAVLGPLAARHALELAGTDEVAGRRCEVVDVRRPGDGAVAGTFWLDAATSIVLRREIYDPAGRVIRASAFISIRVGPTPMPAHLPPASADPWGQPVTTADLSGLRASGWQIPDNLPGMTLYDARRTESSTGMILHLGYSDGLSTVSVFEQRGRLDTARLTGYETVTRGGARVRERVGIPTEVTWSASGRVYTVVADAPPEIVDEAIAVLPHEQQHHGLGSRLGRGLSRVVAWFNPFD